MNYIEELNRNGVVVIRNGFSDNISDMMSIYSKSWEYVKSHWPKIWYSRSYLDSNRKYDNFIGTDLYENRKIGYILDFEIDKEVDKEDGNNDDNMIIDMGFGRYDFTYNLDNEIKKKIKLPDCVMKILENVLECEYDIYYGGLPVENGLSVENGLIGNGRWHRDAYSLFDNERLDLSLPTFYLTIIIPLCKVSRTSGGTEFVIGSHKINISELGLGGKEGIENISRLENWITSLADDMRYCPELDVGDIVIFHGYTIHRGIAISSELNNQTSRDAIYIVAKKNWYNDEPSENYVEKKIINNAE